MHYHTQAAFDWQAQLMKLATLPASEETRDAMAVARREIERCRALASEDAYKIAPYIHPRLAAVAVSSNELQKGTDIIAALLDDIDAKQREPKLIENIEEG